ncbi:MAG: PaaD-like protein (DUF59) involved in Fe-S cluster assembly [Candidatus Bipolaricaulis sibiricus]|uniref:PaaD-like protein (DUF59) involved in Fe-S cluster assembly n=1 Tax=Bipolaricaulis sibiricus TaxID=2501609 RepID=A0A410FVI0_BIPS1|nr:MAG: PaaD-like protein (DUF59) involved in Fe-S cluster assembly [Candidatus Bipolaricaulis sibiricus]
MPTAGEVQAVLRGVTDPELGISVVDLGLVYGVEVEGNHIHVRMTLTAPSCPYASNLASQVERLLREQFVGCEARVTLVWEPRWTPEMMSDDARRQLATP